MVYLKLCPWPSHYNVSDHLCQGVQHLGCQSWKWNFEKKKKKKLKEASFGLRHTVMIAIDQIYKYEKVSKVFKV